MAPEGAAQTDTDDLAQEAADVADATKALRNSARSLHQRASALRDRLAEAGIGFEVQDTQPTAQEGEGEQE